MIFYLLQGQIISMQNAISMEFVIAITALYPYLYNYFNKYFKFDTRTDSFGIIWHTDTFSIIYTQRDSLGNK